VTSPTFSDATWRFLDRLAADNTRATFAAARESYARDVAAPCAAYVDALAELLPERVHPGLRGEAKVGRSLFRINRDVRFSRDKTPYKTHLDFLFWIGDGGQPREQPACIVRLTSSTVLLGAGQMGLKGDALDRYRRRLDDPDDGARLRAVVDALRDGGAELSDPDRVRVPKPYPTDHPRAELLRHDGFHASATYPHPSGVDTTRFPGWCATRLAPYGPLLAWLAES
jgi:uncharacterized protein (TIGR02453 family)